MENESKIMRWSKIRGVAEREKSSFSESFGVINKD
jgi:hypothetical protein